MELTQLFDTIFSKIKEKPFDISLWNDCFESVKMMYNDGDKETAFAYNTRFRGMLDRISPHAEKALLSKLEPLRKETYHLEAVDLFDSYLIYLEWDRPKSKKFYMPRREGLKPLIDALQDLEDGDIQFLGVSCPPRTGKSTTCIFFLTWVMGKRPEVANLMAGHGDLLVKGFYKECLSIIDDPSTYNWNKVFPESRIVFRSSEERAFDLRTEKRFHTLTCRSISGSLTGNVEIGAGGYLYCDDLIRDREESQNLQRLDAKYEAYLNQLKDRKLDGAKELMVGTRWNVFDPLGRVHAQYKDDPTYRFLVMPALDEHDESNFKYSGSVGFSTEYYKDMRESIDPEMWAAKYMGNPYIREGLLFPADELKYFNGVLPPNLRKTAVVDVAWGGGDFLSMPVAYLMDDDLYILDVVFNKGGKNITQPLVASKIIAHSIPDVEFEANNGGDEYKSSVDRILRERGYRSKLTSKPAPNNTSKLNRIIQYSNDIIQHVYFLEPSKRSVEYQMFMDNLTLFSVNGKNEHDDAPDSLTALLKKTLLKTGKAQVFKRPF